MAKFYGAIGFGAQQEIPEDSGNWKLVVTERKLYGDILQNSKRDQENGEVLKEITLQNSISVVADAYASEHFFAIKYVEWAGARWTVTDVKVEGPRLILRLGGVYNGPTPVAAP